MLRLNRHSVRMNPASKKLFEYVIERVSHGDVGEFCPEDPEASGYVADFTAILESKTVPQVYSVSLTETIGITQWADAEEEYPQPRDRNRFLRFRLFTNAVGAAMCSGQKGPDDNLPPNYLVMGLLDDAIALGDEHLLHLLAPVFGEMHERVITARWCADDAPWLLLGQLLLTLRGNYPEGDASALAVRIIEAESHCARRKGKDIFLWGSTAFCQKHDRWRVWVEREFSQTHASEAVRRLGDGLTGRGAFHRVGQSAAPGLW